MQRRLTAFAVILAASLSLACTQLRSPQPEQYFSRSQPPPQRELRWSNGKLPKTIDPALVSSAPDIDVSRAVFEGLTDLDPTTLDAIPAIAESWTPGDDFRTWTFRLREGAKWSDGTPVTAGDFVRSWRRVSEMGAKAPHGDLLANIVGYSKADAPADPTGAADELGILDVSADEQVTPAPEATASPGAPPTPAPPGTPKPGGKNDKPGLDVVALDDRTLRVTLIRPDKDLPKLVSHPVFRPVPAKSAGLDLSKNAQQIVTSGPFRIASAGADGVTLERQQNYWEIDSVKLDRVRFVPAVTPEKALEAYRNGEVDVVTNSAFSNAAVKLLEPYDDFRLASFAALNFYDLNIKKAPFSDRAVREALAIAIEREKLTEGELGGATRPAYGFTPFSPGGTKLLVSDAARARERLGSAGYPNGQGFPVIRLLINRNETQQRIARAVARMWKTNLNVETEIVAMDPDQLAAARKAGDYDAIRKGVVMPTPSETANFIAMFHSDAVPAGGAESPAVADRPDLSGATPTPSPAVAGQTPSGDVDEPELYLTEEAALFELPGIPLYFPASYSLVKPFVKGFDSNSLDAPLLKRVEIDTNWKTK